MKAIFNGLLLLCMAASAAAAADDLARLAEEVRATEVAFAKTLADRDVKAFGAMIAPDVIWLGRRAAARAGPGR